MRIPTVKIVADHPRGWAIINKANFDPKKHVLYGAEAAAAAVQPVPAGVEAPNSLSGAGEAADVPLSVAGDSSELSNDELRAAIEAATGKVPHWKAKRETLITQYRDALSAPQSEASIAPAAVQSEANGAADDEGAAA
ncbi:hypothetical protein [Rhodobium gokarnense]|uniref:Uncharacterized protein n=1 Tax=Rhodobium gokarnense TaxID=364296 RepID=A0ABT3HH46_9HYPH|nr:hypothetical protein [Rhodobium gokarnense]MCW2309718.1 hypothetical protein [Rhodobium gokarnense]